MSQTGGYQIYDRAFTTTVNLGNQGLVVLAGSTEGNCLLPTSDNQVNLPLGVALAAYSSTTDDIESADVPVRLEGTAMVVAGGTVTAGQLVYVTNGGNVANIVTNMTPAQQTILGLALGSGATNDQVEILIRPQFVVQ